MVLQLRQIQRGLNYEFQSDTALRNKIIMSYSNIPACNVAILQSTTIIVELINNIYAVIENNEEVMKAEKSELFDSGTYFIDRKYYINRSLNLIYSKPSTYSFPNNNGFQKKKCFVCDKIGCWSTKHIDKKRQESRNKFVKRFTDSIDKRYESYIQEYEGQEDENVEEKDFEALIFDIQDDLEEAENFVTIIFIITSNQAHARYLELINRFTYHVLTKSAPTLTRYDFKQFYDILLDIGAARTSTSGYKQAQAYMRDFNT